MKVVLASHNSGKLAELGTLLAPLGWSLTDPAALAIPAPDEIHPTFVENALDKARHVSRASGMPALADDSGLVVPALGGLPGIRSARFAGDGATDAANNTRLLEAIAELPRADAFFICVLVLLRYPEDPAPVIASGTWHGTLTRGPRGAHGFGYDPLFLIPELGRTAAELEPAEKNRLSHRGRATAALLAALRAAAPHLGGPD